MNLNGSQSIEDRGRRIKPRATDKDTRIWALRQRIAYERRRDGEMCEDVLVRLVRQRDMKRPKWQCLQEYWRRLYDRNDVGDPEAGEIFLITCSVEICEI